MCVYKIQGTLFSAVPLCCSGIDVFLECSPSLGSWSPPSQCPYLSLLAGSSKVRASLGPCCFSTTSLYIPDSVDDPVLTLWFHTLCWHGPVVWPSSVSSLYCWFKCSPLPVSNHVPSSKLKPESNSILSSGLTVKSLWQSLLWLYFSIVHALDHVLATAGAAEKWLPEEQNWLMKNALLRSKNTWNRKLLSFPMWTK